jgi:hypothetical protein
MRTTLVLAALVVLAGSARAGTDWEGTWKTDKEESRSLTRAGKLLALDVPLADVDKRAFHLVGVPDGHKLRLEGRLEATAGMTGALGGEKSSGRKHTLVLEGELDERTSTADVRLVLDGATRTTEKWSRGGIEILSLECDGSALVKPFDAKLSRSGLVVKYRVNGSALRITASVRPAQGHPYPAFYKGDVSSRDLGTVEPGDRSFTWDGRDGTPAKRIALGGDYVLVLEAGTVSARASFQAAAARFATVGSSWPVLTTSLGTRPAWNPKDHLEQVAALLVTDPSRGAPGFGFEGVRLAKTSDDVKASAKTAASLLISTHGGDGVLLVRGELVTQSYRPSDVFGRDLKDVHFAFVSACSSGAGGPESVVDQLVAAGCDVVVGFRAKVEIEEADAFETVTVALLARGCPIPKAALDAGEALSTTSYHKGTCAPIRGSQMIYTQRGAGIDDSESLWPPRYGCSTN